MIPANDWTQYLTPQQVDDYLAAGNNPPPIVAHDPGAVPDPSLQPQAVQAAAPAALPYPYNVMPQQLQPAQPVAPQPAAPAAAFPGLPPQAPVAAAAQPPAPSYPAWPGYPQATASPPSQPGATSPPAPQPGQAAQPPVTAAEAQPLTDEERNARAIELEHGRREICARYNNPTMTVGEGDEARDVPVLAQAVRENWDLRRTELEAHRAARPSGPAVHGVTPPHETDQSILTAALSINNGCAPDFAAERFGERTIDAAMTGQFQSFNLVALMHATLQAAGRYAPAGQLNDGFMEAALMADREIRAAGQLSTISLSNVLSGAANTHLLEAYRGVAAVWPQICGTTSHNNFHSHTYYRLGGDGEYKEVKPSGDLEHATVTETEVYSNQVTTYGRILSITRVDMKNDSLGAFMKQVRHMGRNGAMKPDKVFHQLLLNGVTSGFFVSGTNLTYGTAYVLGVDALRSIVTAFNKQTDGNGDPIGVTNPRLLVPTELGGLADDMYRHEKVDVSSGSKVRTTDNPHRGKYLPVESPWLSNTQFSNYSTTGWYLCNDPADLAVAEIAFLDGNRTPKIFRGYANIAQLAMQFAFVHDFGIALAESKAAHFVPGVAAP